MRSFKEKCQEIWLKQLDSLSSTRPLAIPSDVGNVEQVEDDSDVQYYSELEREISQREMFLRSNNSSSEEPIAKSIFIKGHRSDMIDILSDIHVPSSSERSNPNDMDSNKPKRVVKQVIRKYLDDGKVIRETTTIRFLFAESEVFRVESEASMNNRSYISPRQALKKKSKAYEDEEDILLDSTKTSLNLNIGTMKRKASQVLNDRDGNVYHQPKRGRPSKQSRLEALGLIDNAEERNKVPLDEEAVLLGIKQKSARKRANIKNVNYRLPLVELSAKFEKEILEIIANKKAPMFHYPVSDSIAGYYDMITHPICLMDILAKSRQFQYSTRREFLNDMHLMARNAETFNGSVSEITKNAWFLYKRLERAVNHEKNHFGEEGDVYRLLEEAISKR